MLSPGELALDAGVTATEWMGDAAAYVEKRFSHYPPTARAQLIAAYVQAAATDEAAMYVGALAEESANAVDAMRSLSEKLADTAAELRRLNAAARPAKPEAPE